MMDLATTTMRNKHYIGELAFFNDDIDFFAAFAVYANTVFVTI